MPWRRKWQTTPVFLPGKFHGQRSLIGYSPWGHKESDTTEWLHFLFSAESPGKEIKGVRIRKEEAKLFLLQMTWIFKSHSERIYKQKTSRGQESAHNARDTGDAGLIPGWRRSPGGGHGNTLQYSCLENFMYSGAWWATVPGVTKSWTRLKQLSTHARMHDIQG